MNENGRRIGAVTAAAVVMLAALGAITGQVQAQAATPAVVDVFLDCQASGCDTQHFRNEIGFVNWVRDRTVADVHVLITSQGSGSGGTVYQLSYIGLREFADDSVTLTLNIAQGQTSGERRDQLTNRLAQGLLRYAVTSSAAGQIRVIYDADGDAAPATPTSDPWNFWVFRLNLNGSLDAESREKSKELEFSANANRVTPEWKFEVETDGSYEHEEFELSSGERTFVTRNWQVDALVTQALARHWSLGVTTETGTNTRENQDLYIRPAGLLEYSFFPYSEYSRRRILVQYTLGARHFDYEERTIYNRWQEMRYDQRLEVSAEFQQPWGSAGVELSGQHYLHNIDRYSLQSRGNLNVRLFRGFGVNLNVNYSRVHDQLYIPAGDADDEEILLRRRALETNYRYGASIGLSYTFGSIYNNVVNPRVGNVNSF